MFVAALTKEFKLIFRDVHSMLVLFIMPSAFIIIMSLAMQEQFSDNGGKANIEILLYNASKSKLSEEMLKEIQGIKQFNFVIVAVDIKKGLKTVEALIAGTEKTYLYIPKTYGVSEGGNVPLEIWLSPKIDPRVRQLIIASVQQVITKSQVFAMLALAKPGISASLTTNSFLPDEDSTIDVKYFFSDKEEKKTPTSVQQSVPAWLIFSMFFVVVPLSITMVTEKQQGTLNRLRTMNVSMELFLCTKIIPYLVINQIQLCLMLLLGIYIVPLLGGGQLSLGGAYLSLFVMSVSTGFAAVGYGLLIATMAKTTEQASSIGGIGNILLGAIGGIMVPKFIMPDFMQFTAQVSPMSWGLDGFLDIFLENGGVSDIFSEAMMLVIFGIIMMLLSMLIFSRTRVKSY